MVLGTLFQNGQKIENNVGCHLDELKANQTISIMIDSQRNLKLFVNGVDHGIKVKNIPPICYGMVDLYGQCEEISIVPGNSSAESRSDSTENSITEGTSVSAADVTATGTPAAASKMTPAVIQQHPHVLRTSSHQNDQSLSTNAGDKCSYLKLCSRFKTSLSIPSHFLSGLQPCCFCMNCIKSRGEELYKKKGDPLKDYATPVNWVRFPVRQFKSEQSTESWHTTYHGTKPSSFRKILDHGELVPILGFGLTHKSTSKPKESKEDDVDTPQLVFSPTLNYFLQASQSCSPCPYRDAQKNFKARLAFEVDIHPGSYKIGPPSQGGFSSGSGILIDAHFKLDETEWLTKEKGNTAIKALLVHLEPVLS